jgi:hypothetical protein
MSWSPDSTRVLVNHEGAAFDWFVVDVTGQELRTKHVELNDVGLPVLVSRDLVAAHSSDALGTCVVLADRDSGRVISRLFAAGNQIRALAADASGRFVLISDNDSERLAWGSVVAGRVPLGDHPAWDVAWVPD